MEWCEHLAKDGELGLVLEAQPWKDGLRLCGSVDGVLCLARRAGSQHQKGSRAGMRRRAVPVDGVHCRYWRRSVSRYDKPAGTHSNVSDDPARRARDQAADRVFRRTAWPIKIL